MDSVLDDDNLANDALAIMIENGHLAQAEARTRQFQHMLIQAVRTGNGAELDRLGEISVEEHVPVAVRQADVDQATIAFITNPAIGVQQKIHFIASISIPMDLAEKPVIEQMVLHAFYKVPVAQLIDLFQPVPDPPANRLRAALDFMESMLHIGEDSAVTLMLATNRFSPPYYRELMHRLLDTMCTNHYNLGWDFFPVKTFEFLALWHVDAIATLPPDFRQEFVGRCTQLSQNARSGPKYRVLLPFVFWGAEVHVDLPLGPNVGFAQVLQVISDVTQRSVIADAAGELHTVAAPNLSSELCEVLVDNIDAYKAATDLFPNWFTENPQTITNVIVDRRAMSVLTFMGDNYKPGIGTSKRIRVAPWRTLNKFIIDAVMESQWIAGVAYLFDICRLDWKDHLFDKCDGIENRMNRLITEPGSGSESGSGYGYES